MLSDDELEADARALRRLRWGASLLVLGGFLALIIYGCAYMFAGYQGLDYNCIVAGPFSPLAVKYEAATATGHFGHWPLGRECEWGRADGAGTVIARSDNWTGTLVLGSALLIALWGVLLMIAGTVRRPTRTY
jgi:hypothetical protein